MPEPVGSNDPSSPFKQSSVSRKPVLHFEDNARNFSVSNSSVQSGVQHQSGSQHLISAVPVDVDLVTKS